MRVQDVMTRDIVHISPEEAVAAARQQLRMHGVHHLLVIRRKEVVGVISDRDLLEVSDDRRVSDVMTRNPVTISADATLRQAAGILDGRTIGCLPVLKEGRLEGILTRSDVVRAVAKGAVHLNGSGQRMNVKKKAPHRRASM